MSLLGKAKEYLFKDSEYIAAFGPNMDYEAYWVARCQQDGEMERAMYAYKFQLIDHQYSRATVRQFDEDAQKALARMMELVAHGRSGAS
jgi:hypothetical protein